MMVIVMLMQLLRKEPMERAVGREIAVLREIVWIGFQRR